MLRGNRDLRNLFLAEIVSYMGDWFATVAFLGVVQDASDSKVLVTLVLVCQSFPTFLLGPLAGSAADRFDRRKIVIVVSIGQSIAALGLVVVTSSTLWLGYVSLALIAALASFVTPATQAAIPNLARDPDELHVANTFGGALWGAMLGIGAGLGGLFAGVFGRRAAFVADAVSFALAALFIFLIRTAMQERGHDASGTRMRPIADLREAIAYARRVRASSSWTSWWVVHRRPSSSPARPSASAPAQTLATVPPLAWWSRRARRAASPMRGPSPRVGARQPGTTIRSSGPSSGQSSRVTSGSPWAVTVDGCSAT